MRKYEAQALLYSTLPGRFIHNISVPDDVPPFLKACRTKIRQAIRQEFAAIQNAIKNNQWHAQLEGLDYETRLQLEKLEPKFWPQGSIVYKTLNAPFKSPPQHIDLDDGVYLPMAIMSDQPVLKKQIFFNIVELALEKLCSREGWKTDFSKDTCCRVKINKHIHVDVPLYAIPDDRYRVISIELAENRQLFKADAEQPYQIVYLNENEVYLAVRNHEHWIQSDPMQIQKWFKEALDNYYERLRRVCRYLKAWRDYTWPEGGGPSSIALMICAVDTFANNYAFEKDCEALLAVAKALPNQLQQGVYIDDEQFYPRKKQALEQASEVQKAKEFAATMTRALEFSNSANEVVANFRLALGDRIPNRPDFVSLLAVAPHVRTTSRVTQPEPRDMSSNLRSGNTNYRSG